MTAPWLPQLKAKFGTLDAASLTQLEKMVQTFEDTIIANKPKERSEEPYLIKTRRAVSQLIHSLEISPNQSSTPRIFFRLEARELDFSLGENVYSTTPRLLIKVPERREEGAKGYITIPPIGDAHDEKFSGATITDKTVLVIHNQEGEEPALSERRIKQQVGLTPGEYVLFGGMKMTDRKAVYDVFAKVMNPPEGKSAFQYFDEAGTVEDLAKILHGIQDINFGNMYNSHDKYRTKNVQPIPAFEGKTLEPGLSGFYEKPVDAVVNSMVFLPGPMVFLGRGRSEETLPENGFAVLEQVVGAEDYNIRPQSPGFIEQNYVYRLTRTNVDSKPPAGVGQIMFVPDHPLRDFVREFAGFQFSLSDFNHGVHLKPKASPDFKATAG